MFIDGEMARGQGRTTVMIVDDRELFREGLKMILELSLIHI